MHIPRQADRHGGARPAHADATPAGTVTAAAVVPVEGLRARRAHLVHQLRSVGYWQRLVQARTDLVVAGLLYSAPSPTPGTPTWAPAGSPRAVDGALDLQGLAAPPEGVDVAHLLEAPDRSGRGPAGPGARLDRLRATAALLTGHSRALQEELDEVTAALHHGLALDGADQDPPADLPGTRTVLTAG